MTCCTYKEKVALKIWALLLTIISIFLAITQRIAIAQEVPPVLEFPQSGLDDTTTYRGYTTRFFQDTEANTLQIYIKQNSGRIVNIWGDAANESISFTARDDKDKAATLTWGSPGAKVVSKGRIRYIQYMLSSNVSKLVIGHFVLGTMRIERDFQHFKKHTLPFDSEPYITKELPELVGNLKQLPEDVRARHLTFLNAESLEDLRSRLVPQIIPQSKTNVLVEQPTFDGKNHLSLELSVDDNHTIIQISKNKISIESLQDQPIRLTVKISTDSPSLTPLSTWDIFNEEFFHFYIHAKSARLERQVKSMRLLSSHEKLMAGMPNYATYFGRDMMMSALMLESVLKPEMLEHVIASVLKKLTPTGEVSHEEGLGGQAIRENAAKYNKLITEYLQHKTKSSVSATTLAATEKVLEGLQAVTENYHMVDDDFQLPVLTARYLMSSDIPDTRKREFLQSPISSEDETTRLTLLLWNLDYVARVSSPYVENRVPENLISFRKLDEHRWHAGSWRDSAVGYANGRYAMDINAIWVPKALGSIKKIFATLRAIGISIDDLQVFDQQMAATKLREYARSSAALDQAIKTWSSAVRHFEVHLSAQEVQRRIRAKLDWLSVEERAYWEAVIARDDADKQDIEFLVISLDEKGQPIPVVHTDVATWLFLNNFTEEILRGEMKPEDVLWRLKLFVVPYPVGLFLEGIGPAVANDVYASTDVWENFKRDLYHSPRVIWGREVNLLFLGLAKQILAAYDAEGRIKDANLGPYIQELRAILEKTLAAVEASGLKQNELWSYRIEGKKLVPARYATTTDIQLWNLTDLAVQFLLGRLKM